MSRSEELPDTFSCSECQEVKSEIEYLRSRVIVTCESSKRRICDLTSRASTTIHQHRISTNMSSNVGLSTPRGSGTSGYVQSNKAHLRTRDNAKPYPSEIDSIKQRQRQPDKDILEHDRKREIEVKVFELRDKLEDEGYAIWFLYMLAIC